MSIMTYVLTHTWKQTTRYFVNHEQLFSQSDHNLSYTSSKIELSISAKTWIWPNGYILLYLPSAVRELINLMAEPLVPCMYFIYNGDTGRVSLILLLQS